MMKRAHEELGDFTTTPRVLPISLADMLKARTRHLEEERRREQMLTFGGYFARPDRGGQPPAPADRATSD